MSQTFCDRAGVPRLKIRKWSTVIGAFGSAACMAAFVRCKTPLKAAISSYGVFGFYCFHHSGFGANLLEVGGTQTAMLNAVNNMIKSAAGIICPPLGVFLVRRTGSWHALFYGIAVLQEFSDEQLMESVAGPRYLGNVTRVKMAYFTLSHAMDIYGQMAVYLRLNDVTPPASRRGGV